MTKVTDPQGEPVIIDAADSVLGRLCSHVAKKLLKGEQIVIVNAEKARITGNSKRTKGKYIQRRQVGSPQHGPYYPIRPDMVLRRAVRGMVPYKTRSGKTAMKGLKVFVGIPNELENHDMQKVSKKISAKSIQLGEALKSVGWKG